MERQRQATQPVGEGGPGSAPDDALSGLDGRLTSMLDSVDQALDSVRPVVAEDYLQQNRQQSAQ